MDTCYVLGVGSEPIQGRRHPYLSKENCLSVAHRTERASFDPLTASPTPTGADAAVGKQPWERGAGRVPPRPSLAWCRHNRPLCPSIKPASGACRLRRRPIQAGGRICCTAATPLIAATAASDGARPRTAQLAGSPPGGRRGGGHPSGLGAVALGLIGAAATAGSRTGHASGPGSDDGRQTTGPQRTGRQRTDDRRRGYRRQTTGRQTTDDRRRGDRQRTIYYKQQTTDNRQQTADDEGLTKSAG